MSAGTTTPLTTLTSCNAWRGHMCRRNRLQMKCRFMQAVHPVSSAARRRNGRVHPCSPALQHSPSRLRPRVRTVKPRLPQRRARELIGHLGERGSDGRLGWTPAGTENASPSPNAPGGAARRNTTKHRSSAERLPKVSVIASRLHPLWWRTVGTKSSNVSQSSLSPSSTCSGACAIPSLHPLPTDISLWQDVAALGSRGSVREVV